MGTLIHARRTPAGLRYRLWSTVADGYTTEELSAHAVCERLALDYSAREWHYGVPDRDIPARLERANAHGTSEIGDTRDLDGPWDTERCNGCGTFHHAFAPRADGTCGRCGEPEADASHAPPCQRR